MPKNRQKSRRRMMRNREVSNIMKEKIKIELKVTSSMMTNLMNLIINKLIEIRMNQILMSNWMKEYYIVERLKKRIISKNPNYYREYSKTKIKKIKRIRSKKN